MKSLSSFGNIYLHRDAVDMRKQINGLTLFVQDSMKLDMFSPALFIFTNKKRNMVKMIYWDKTGFALWLKRLEKERFLWPRKHGESVLALTPEQLAWLLDGYDLSKMRPHKELKYKKVG